MKVHKMTFEESNSPGSIWAAVAIAKKEHKDALRYKKAKDWALAEYCRSTCGTMMHTIRVIARGLLTSVERSNKTAKP